MRLSIFVTTLSCFLVACGGSGSTDPILGPPDLTNAPRVILTTPSKSVPLVSGVATNTQLTAKFSRDMLASSLNASSFTVACPVGTAVIGTVSYDGINQLATLQHVTDFPINTTCEATISTAVTDTTGIALAKDYVWSFTTGAASDTTAPTVMANSPASAATAVCLAKT